ncbi:hypothetical protein IWQ60_010121 [Tieghemiomyces parasiticus]|uniref:PLC-like phosphodiesterase n=1 Tax=Tieghemiomyces parasiticus TaxID=78921 RepID=A0A9W7ZR77_9FUNG|nr:hypothetical protein IWQ60_010121 [Tieghemiomyces parasiticus]
MRLNALLPVLAAGLSATTTYAASSPSACNGYADLCNRPYSQVAYPTTHNSYAAAAGIAGNQNRDISLQLADGIRGLMLDFVPSSTMAFQAADSSNDNSGGIELCHTACLFLDAGSAADGLTNVTTFLKANQDEVVTILIENVGKFSAAQMASVFQKAGLDTYAWTQPASGDTELLQSWPTLATMIAQNKRLVVFADQGADQASVPWIHPEYVYMWETPWEVMANDATFNCNIDRPSSPQTPAKTYGALSVLNHFAYINQQFLSTVYEVSASSSAGTTNHIDSLQKHYEQCAGVYTRQKSSLPPLNDTSRERIPNFISVDYYDTGDLFRFTAQLNNVTFNSKPLTSNGTSSSNSNSAASAVRLPTLGQSILTLAFTTPLVTALAALA